MNFVGKQIDRSPHASDLMGKGMGWLVPVAATVVFTALLAHICAAVLRGLLFLLNIKF